MSPEALAFYTLLVVFAWREWINTRTINQLMDRLMARSLPEFKRAQIAKRDIPIPTALTDAQMAAMEAERMAKANDFSAETEEMLRKAQEIPGKVGAA